AVGGRGLGARVEREAGGRRGAREARAGVGAMVVLEPRADGGSRRVQALAQVQVERGVGGLPALALVARPAEVADGRRVREAVDLLPRVPADVAHPQLAGAGPERAPVRVAAAVGDDAPAVGMRVGDLRLAGPPLASV